MWAFPKNRLQTLFHACAVTHRLKKAVRNDMKYGTCDYWGDALVAGWQGLREAIKAGNKDEVKRLLAEGVDPTYRDQQGMTLLHVVRQYLPP